MSQIEQGHLRNYLKNIVMLPPALSYLRNPENGKYWKEVLVYVQA
jgi:hypothetical protein